MAIKDLTQLKQQQQEMLAQILGMEQLLSQCADVNSDEGVQLRGRIATLRDNYDQAQRSLVVAADQQVKKERKTRWTQEQPLVDQAMDQNHMGYVAPLDQFIYCKNYGREQSNMQFKLVLSSRIIRIMNKLTGSTISSRECAEMIDYFESRGRSFLDVTASFNTSKWDESQVYNKMSVIRSQWLQPNYAQADQYDTRFDVLITAVCGGREENIAHLEQWVAFKYLYPEKNANTPNIDMGGMPGGNGKGRFVEILKTIFTPTCVIQAHKEELEKFNANWEMAVVLYYDEPEEKELAAGKLKQATGAEDMRIEKKGIDATMADRNYNFVFMSNNQQGVVKLSGGSDGGEDRRYSVINTDLVLFDLLRDIGQTEDQARDWLNGMAQQLVKDPAEVSRWLAHIIQKHQMHTATVLPALHGEDYVARFQTQKDPLTQAFDRILPVWVRNGIISQALLTEAVRVITDNDRYKEHSVAEKFGVYLRRNKHDFRVQDKARYSIVQDGVEQRQLQHKLIVADTAGKRCFEWSSLSTKQYQANPVTDALRIEHLAI